MLDFSPLDRLAFVIFAATLSLCLTTYFAYPIAIWALGRLAPFTVRTADIYPFVSILISAYNEEKNIEAKIVNTLALEYPRGNMEVIVGSDGSSDRTVQIVNKFTDRGIRCIPFEQNRGKTAVQNDLARAAKGEILIFMDAASFVPPDAVRKLVRGFADPRVACVAGRLSYHGTHCNLTTKSQHLYWRYEAKIRELESRLGRLAGLDGPLYAVRRQCYVPLDDSAISDLLTPLLILLAGKRVVLASDAAVYENPTVRPKQEFQTRRRITLRGLTTIFTHPSLLNPFRSPALASQIFFHKLLRWFVGPLVGINLISCCLLRHRWPFSAILAAYLIFIACATLGLLLEITRQKAPKIFVLPYYFCLVNLAAALAILDYARGRRAVTWTPIRTT
jgi:cellulose synthase/poly-beta-1,6-N-acetylglucosamine synthase-like glycosyltransferase